MPQGSFGGLLDSSGQTQLIDPNLMPTAPLAPGDVSNLLSPTIRARRSGDRLIVDINAVLYGDLDNTGNARIKLPPGLHINTKLYPARSDSYATYTISVGRWLQIFDGAQVNIMTAYSSTANSTMGAVFIDTNDSSSVYLAYDTANRQIRPATWAAVFEYNSNNRVDIVFDIPIAEWAESKY